MMEEIDRFQVPPVNSEMQPLDPAATTTSEADSELREVESVPINYKPSPLQVKIEKQRELARKGSAKNGTASSPVNQQPKKNNVMARTRLVVPNKGYSSLDQSPDEKPLVALDTDSDDDFDMSRYSSSGYSSAEQINQDLNIQLLKDGYRLDEIPDDEDLDLIPPKSVNPTCCHGAMVVAEARSADDSSLTRRCAIMRLTDFTLERFLEVRRQNAAAVLILIPQNLSTISDDVIQSFMITESEALKMEMLMPVYVVPEDEQLLYMYAEVKHAAATKSASILIRVLHSMISTTAFQILVNNNSPIKAITDSSIITLEGVLPGVTEDAPTIVITAHYDSFGLAPWMSYGADSNGSGVTILVELARLFQRLYSDPRNKAPFHLLFSLTGGGKYNYIGTKRWLAENMDHAESSLLHDNVAFVLCLDSLGSGDELFFHVSRPPKPGTPLFSFIQHLEYLISSRFPWVKFGTVHKKINLQESTLAWEHECYGIKHIPAFTLSHLQDPKSERRGSILDTMSQVDIRKLKRNTVVVAEALVRYMYNLSDKLMDTEPQNTLLLNSLEQEFRRHLQQVYRHTFRQAHRDPDITFFDQMKQPVMMYRVKPAAFDLFLGGCIAGYLGFVYFAIQVCSTLDDETCIHNAPCDQFGTVDSIRFYLQNFGYVYMRFKAVLKNKQ
ncbi:Nicalin-1 [Bagarius yarrelli]|uniref:BOS complex subunit NCLN n=6 Tax=Euteleostomi TaxID=117571 RepID=A0A556TUC9_BAGYA|nr:Nicalin-1 [Bagarius yarrelli]